MENMQNTKTRAAMKVAFKQKGTAKIAAACGYSAGTLSNMVSGQKPYAPGGTAKNIVDNCIDLIEACENELLLQYICDHFGYAAVKKPQAGADGRFDSESLSAFFLALADLQFAE